MRIGILIMVISFLIAMLASIGGTAYCYSQSMKVVTNQVYSHLESVAQSRAHHIESRLKMEKDVVKSLALTGKVERLLLASESDSDYNDKKIAVNERVQKTVDSIEQIIHIQIINKDGITIAGTNPALLGVDRSSDPRFPKLNEGEIAISSVGFSPEDGNPRLSIASPVLNNNEIIGFVFVRVDIEKSLYPLLLDKTGIGETGETYLVNNDGYAITPLKFEEDAVLKYRVDSINSRNCFVIGDIPKDYIGYEIVKTFLDYRGKKVIGTYSYIKEMDWCLLAEIDEEEILGVQRELFQKITFMIIIVVIALTTLIGFFIGKHLNKIVVLKKGRKRL